MGKDDKEKKNRQTKNNESFGFITRWLCWSTTRRPYDNTAHNCYEYNDNFVHYTSIKWQRQLLWSLFHESKSSIVQYKFVYTTGTRLLYPPTVEKILFKLKNKQKATKPKKEREEENSQNQKIKQEIKHHKCIKNIID